jgi:type I site-specific restriction endonuclease
VAIRRIIERTVAGQKKIMSTMVTRTGKIFRVFQIARKLKQFGWRRPAKAI